MQRRAGGMRRAALIQTSRVASALNSALLRRAVGIRSSDCNAHGSGVSVKHKDACTSAECESIGGHVLMSNGGNTPSCKHGGRTGLRRNDRRRRRQVSGHPERLYKGLAPGLRLRSQELWQHVCRARGRRIGAPRWLLHRQRLQSGGRARRSRHWAGTDVRCERTRIHGHRSRRRQHGDRRHDLLHPDVIAKPSRPRA
jgi:hypothetical protein